MLTDVTIRNQIIVDDFDPLPNDPALKHIRHLKKLVYQVAREVNSRQGGGEHTHGGENGRMGRFKSVADYEANVPNTLCIAVEHLGDWEFASDWSGPQHQADKANYDDNTKQFEEGYYMKKIIKTYTADAIRQVADILK